MTLLSYEEFEARRRAERAKWEAQGQVLMRERERLLEAHRRQRQEGLSQLDAFDELLRLDGEKSERESANAPRTSKVQVTIDELTRLTQELARLRRVQGYLELLLSLQQSMYLDQMIPMIVGHNK